MDITIKETTMDKEITLSHDFNEMLSDWASNPNADPYIRAIAAETLASYFKRLNAIQPYIDAVELAASCWKQVAKLGEEECTFEKLFVEQLVMFSDEHHPASMDKAIASELLAGYHEFLGESDQALRMWKQAAATWKELV